MNLLVKKVALAASVALVALSVVENAYARPLRYRAAPVDYSVADPRYQRHIIAQVIGRDSKANILYHHWGDRRPSPDRHSRPLSATGHWKILHSFAAFELDPAEVPHQRKSPDRSANRARRAGLSSGQQHAKTWPRRRDASYSDVGRRGKVSRGEADPSTAVPPGPAAYQAMTPDHLSRAAQNGIIQVFCDGTAHKPGDDIWQREANVMVDKLQPA